MSEGVPQDSASVSEPDAAASFGAHPVLAYTVKRVLLLAGVGGVLYLVGVRGLWLVLFAFLAGGLWIGWTLAATGTILLAIFRDIPLDKLVAQYTWNILTTQELLALPLFILMGEILFRTRLSLVASDHLPLVADIRI